MMNFTSKHVVSVNDIRHRTKDETLLSTLRHFIYLTHHHEGMLRWVLSTFDTKGVHSFKLEL